MLTLNSAHKRIIELLLRGDRSLPELVEGLRRSKPVVLRYCRELESAGILEGRYERTERGRLRVYSLRPFQLLLSVDPGRGATLSFEADTPLDPEFPLLGQVPQRELRSSVKAYLRALLGTGLEGLTAVLYGSAARGEATRKSDVDLLLVKERWTEADRQKALDAISSASMEADHQAKPLFVTPDGFEDMDPDLRGQIKEHGAILLEKGETDGRLWSELKRYGRIMI